jgi:hypothetical protein
MKKIISIIFGIIIWSMELYSQNSDVYHLNNVIPDNENEGLNLFCDIVNDNELFDFDYNDLLDEISIVESGWIDLIGDESNTEFYMKYYIEKRKQYHIMVLTKRHQDVNIHILRWSSNASIDYNVIFFKRNNKPYIILDERSDFGVRVGIDCDFSILEYEYNPELNYWDFYKIYDGRLGFGGEFEFIENKIVFHNKEDNNSYFLNFNNSVYELIR